jgi:hypothetical protein
MRSLGIGLSGLMVWTVLLPFHVAASQADRVMGVDSVVTTYLRDVHPLYGGQNLFLSDNGRGFCQLVSRHPGSPALFEKRYEFIWPRNSMRSLAEIMSAHSLIDIPSSMEPGLPDSARPKISVRLASGKSVDVSRWQHDNNPDFDAIYRALLEVVKSCAQTGKLFVEGRYDPKWLPGGFQGND